MVTTALQACCDGWGLTVTLGMPKVKPEVTAHYGIFLTGRTLKGSLFGGWKPKSDLPSLVDICTQKREKEAAKKKEESSEPNILVGKFAPTLFEFQKIYLQEIQVDEYITHNLPFEDVNKAFNLMREGKCLLCVIHMAK
ncbi:hypothetical protein L3X38_029547 [Prunus dulcis]|uniref:Uncharacterized protein n=1 Tax=Prunus dulcis TaxID=3755 RepID=A0AAD4VRV1_PRUDU|nr:hypothetical protein L3X38_029547 [Prunus dulcis]